MARIGIFGGSFDPIHIGHLRAAEEVREALRLDRVRFVPAAVPPHKTDRELTDGRARLEMVKLAVADHPAFSASAMEIERGGTSYSVDTLSRLHEDEPDAAFFFIVGDDAFREIHTWKDCERVFELASLVVVERPPRPLEPSIEHLPVAAQNSFCYDPLTRSYRHQSGNGLHFLSTTAIDVSSTDLRQRFRERRSVRYLVPDAVERYVREKELYGAS